MNYFEQRVSRRVAKKVSWKTFGASAIAMVAIATFVSVIILNNTNQKIDTVSMELPETYSTVQTVIEQELVKYDGDTENIDIESVEQSVRAALEAAGVKTELQPALIRSLVERSVHQYSAQSLEKPADAFSHNTANQVTQLVQKADANNEKYSEVIKSYEEYKTNMAEKTAEISEITKQIEVLKLSENSSYAEVKKLLEERMGSASGTEKAHYEELLSALAKLEKSSGTTLESAQAELAERIREAGELSDKYNEATKQKLSEIDGTFLANREAFETFKSAYDDYKQQTTEAMESILAEMQNKNDSQAENLEKAVTDWTTSFTSFKETNTQIINQNKTELQNSINSNKTELQNSINSMKQEQSVADKAQSDDIASLQNALGTSKIRIVSQAQYNALKNNGELESDAIYFINGD